MRTYGYIYHGRQMNRMEFGICVCMYVCIIDKLANYIDIMNGKLFIQDFLRGERREGDLFNLYLLNDGNSLFR